MWRINIKFYNIKNNSFKQCAYDENYQRFFNQINLIDFHTRNLLTGSPGGPCIPVSPSVPLSPGKPGCPCSPFGPEITKFFTSTIK